MRLTLFLSVFVFVLLSCNETKQEDTSQINETAMKDAVKKAVASLHDSVISTIPVLIARGSEPGWYAEFFNDHFQLVTDYGKDTILLRHDFSGIGSGESYTTSLNEFFNDNGKTHTRNLVIKLEAKPCTEEGSGEKREKSIIIQYDNKTYKGCAHRVH